MAPLRGGRSPGEPTLRRRAGSASRAGGRTGGRGVDGGRAQAAGLRVEVARGVPDDGLDLLVGPAATTEFEDDARDGERVGDAPVGAAVHHDALGAPGLE